MFIANEKFSSIADIRQKVDQSIIRYKEKAFYARNIGDSDHITLYRVGSKTDDLIKKSKKILYNDPELDFSSPPLGYSNISKTTCIFLSRIPSRRWQSGLVAGALESSSVNGIRCAIPFDFPWSDELRKTIDGEYESALSIFKMNKDNDEAWSQAFDRNLAFGFTKTNGIRLYHKHVPIAFFNKTNNCFESTHSTNFLVDTILHKYGLKSYVA